MKTQVTGDSYAIGEDGIEVSHLPLDENNQGEWLIPLDKIAKKAILILSGSTWVT
jgi:hypothetical protein